MNEEREEGIGFMAGHLTVWFLFLTLQGEATGEGT